MLEIKTGHTSLHITLTGKGVSPMIQINMPMQDGVLDMGAVLAGEYLERTFKVRNINKGFLYEEGLYMPCMLPNPSNEKTNGFSFLFDSVKRKGELIENSCIGNHATQNFNLNTLF